MLQQDVSTASTLQLVATDMTEIMENLDTRELDIGDGEDVFEGPGANSAGETGRGKNPSKFIQMFKPLHIFTRFIPGSSCSSLLSWTLVSL